MPTACSYEDLTKILSYVSIIPENQITQNTELVEIRVLYRSYKFYHDVNFFIIV